ncbi:MAG: hypothetical protein ACRD59_04405 [Candidatus Acidiferrales bacterium]
MSNRTYGKLAIGIIGAWFAIAMTASAAHVFKATGDAPPIALGLSVAVPLVIYWIWYRASAGFRSFVLSLDVRALTVLQGWRIAGFVFVVLYVYGILPGYFANPAGWGDIAIGLTAPWVAMKMTEPGHRNGFIAWNFLGMLDLTSAITLGTTSRLLHPHGLAADAMSVLPMSVVPTFLVPLFFILHTIAIAQARRWREPAEIGTRATVSA